MASPSTDTLGLGAAGDSVAVADEAPAPLPPPPPVTVPDADARPVFERPESMRGLYLNAWAAGSSRRMNEFSRIARETEEWYEQD